MVVTFLFGIFGLIVGSFLNVLVIRRGVRSLGGRSGCMACREQLLWYDMIPVVSWIMLSGKCRHCFARISIQYPLVEGLTAILFALLGFWVGSAPLGFYYLQVPLIVDYLCIIAILVAITAYDIRHTIIPDSWAYAFAALAFISQFLTPLPYDFPWMQFLFAGPIAASPLFFLWLVSRGKWMGLGDSKLALGIGWFLGPTMGLVAVFLAFVIGGIVSAPLLLFSTNWGKRLLDEFIPYSLWSRSGMGFTMKSEIPFGPFLILSCITLWLFLLYGVDPLQNLMLFPMDTF